MERFFAKILHHKKVVAGVFLVLAILSGIMAVGVGVNYRIVEYLPPDSESTQGIEILRDEFGGDLPNARVMISNVSVSEALAYKDILVDVDGVLDVTWLDDAVGRETLTETPLAYLDTEIAEAYYLNDRALYTVTIENGKEISAVRSIRNLIGDENQVAGDAVNSAAMQEMSGSEVSNAMFILIPVVLLILILTSGSWLEPLLFLVSIGMAVVINMGTNLIFGEVSFVTQSVAPILQMAVSLDYAIFLLHSFREYREQFTPEVAMAKAMKRALASVAASAATTVVGFLALLFMRFGIGADLGIVLVKGVILSFVSVMLFLPVLTLLAYPLLEKTAHKPFLPSFQKAGKFFVRIRLPLLIVAVIVVVPAYLAQSKTQYMYGTETTAAVTRAGKDSLAIDEAFGQDKLLVLLVPRGNPGAESALSQSLQELDHVTGVVSYTTAVGSDIPPEYIPEENASIFYSENYARILIYTDLASEGDTTFASVNTLREHVSSYYPTSYLAGSAATLTDMRTVVSSDTVLINAVAIIGILIVLLVTFRSISIPVILTFVIETAIWINLSFGYFSGQAYNFIGFLVISTVQLGATVDYAILITDQYLGNRKTMRKKDAILKTLGANLPAVLTSALILSLAGITLAMTSTNGVVAELGTLLGRGTILSLLMVICVLPSMLLLLDRFIQKTTFAHGFHKGKAPDPIHVANQASEQTDFKE